ncbi:MAG: AI-2E family transporter [Parcubacteria group bacterium]|jgi:predicted PurR-regulated permease PerM
MENKLWGSSTEIIFKIMAIALGLWFLYLIRDVLVLFFVAIIVMAAIDPLVSWFKLKIKIPRIMGVLIIYLFLISILVAIISFIIPALSGQFRDFLIALPSYFQKVDYFLRGVSLYGQSYGFDLNLGKISENFGESSFNIFSTTVGFFSGLISFVVVFSMAFYMSIHEDGMENFLDSVTPERYKLTVIKIAKRIKNRIGRWMSGQLVLMLTIFLLDYAILYFLGVPYALFIAMISGFLEIIPYIGPTIAVSLATLITVLVSPVKAIFVLVFYVIVHQIESNIIFPQIMKKAVGLNPLAVILSMLIGLKLAGVAGAILAVPVATAVGVVAKELMKKNNVKI